MEVKFNIARENRKAIVKSVSKITGMASQYLGAPTFSYQVGDFEITRNGVLRFDDRTDSKMVENLLVALTDVEFEFEADKTSQIETEAQPDESENTSDTAKETAAHENITEETYTNATPPAHECDSGSGNDAADHTAPTEDDDAIGLTISLPAAHFNEAARTNLKNLIDSKAALIKKAIGIDALPIEITDEKISFPWFKVRPDTIETKAYTHFISAVCDMAKSLKRVTAREREITNEKYTFRCFLLRLGFIGSEYKDERKILLRNLEGSGAFLRGDRRATTHSEEAVNDALSQ